MRYVGNLYWVRYSFFKRFFYFLFFEWLYFWNYFFTGLVPTQFKCACENNLYNKEDWLLVKPWILLVPLIHTLLHLQMLSCINSRLEQNQIHCFMCIVWWVLNQIQLFCIVDLELGLNVIEAKFWVMFDLKNDCRPSLIRLSLSKPTKWC